MADVAATTRTLNFGYIRTLPGLLKIGEVVLGLICWACLASAIEPRSNSQSNYVMFVGVTSWVLTLVTLFIYLFSLHATMCSGAPWKCIEFIFNAFWGLFYFIASCILAASGYASTLVAASAAFGFFTTIVYIAHTLVAFKEWRGAYPWESRSNGQSGADVEA